MDNTKKIFLTLGLIVLLPAIFYSVYEISSLDETETMLGELYGRQLDAVLFSVNQHALDVSSGWATQIENGIPSGDLNRLLNDNPSIVAVIVADTSLDRFRRFPDDVTLPDDLLQKHSITFGQLIRYRALNYRKLEPIVASDSALLILFAPSSAPALVAGIMIRTDRFVADVIGRKLSDIARNDLVLNVASASTGATLFSTHPGITAAFSQERPLWILPDHVVKVRMLGSTVEEAARTRFRENMALIIALNIVLLAGAVMAYRMIKREMELVALRTDFVSNVSHELRTPLALIRMFAETLEMKRVKTEAKRQEYYSIILHETERLTRLINNILNFSRMESRTRRYTFAPADLNALIGSVLTVYSYRLETLGFTVETSLAPELPLITADEEAIAEALHNLIDNAIKYSGERKFLRLTTAVEQDAVRITVQDRGIGIPQEHQGKVFEKFYRVSQGLVHTAKGSGLGLAIVHHIVHAHSGTITVQSEPGSGSTFTVTLPVTPPPQQER
ncbi:MAG: GHKL domain-containing protein [Bacteroidetes bacterium]|nr:GHKL domain-containing protein [Bacteroidota bacterium]